MNNLEEKLSNNRLGDGRIQEEGTDKILTTLIDLIITLSIGSEDLFDL